MTIYMRTQTGRVPVSGLTGHPSRPHPAGEENAAARPTLLPQATKEPQLT
jgi:hypothetical protein